MDEFIDQELGRMVALREVGGCSGCAYDRRPCPDVVGINSYCSRDVRDDGGGIIWVRAEDAPQEPMAARLTDEQIAQIIALTWGSVDIAPQSAAAFARAIEAAAIRANNLEMPE